MLVIIFLLTLGTFLFYNFHWKRRNLPPGPTPLPIVGNLHTFSKYPPGYEAFKLWAKQFGPVYTMWIGNKPMVIITDYQIIREALVTNGMKYAGRPANPMDRELRKGNYGIITASGEVWSQHRRFAMRVLRDFGFGKNLMEERIMYEVEILIDKIRKETLTGPIDLQDFFDVAVGSVINNILLGYRFDESNIEEFLSLKAKMAQFLQIMGHPSILVLMMIPSLKHFPYFNQKYSLIASITEELHTFFRDQIARHKEEIDFNNEDSTDYVESYLKEQRKYSTEENFGEFSEIQLLNTLFDLWTGGLETTSNTLYWGVLYVLHHPEVQQKLHEELNGNVQTGRFVNGSDKAKLHYVNAVIAEVQRLCNLVPFNVPHLVTEDVILGGHKLRKDTVVIPQICTVLFDEKIFPEPYKFDPDRHLDDNGCFVKLEEMIPFSMGKRVCLGEGLARAELFLFLSNIYHAFDFAPVDPNNMPSIEKTFGGNIKAKNFQLLMKSRF